MYFDHATLLCRYKRTNTFTQRWQIASMITILNQISTVIIEFKHRDRKLVYPNKRCISDVVWYHEFFSNNLVLPNFNYLILNKSL